MLDWAILAARLLQYAGGLILFGSALFLLYGMDEEQSPTSADRPPWAQRLLLAAAIVALAGNLAWLMGETASLTGELRNGIDWTSLWSMVSDTRFGRIGALRIAVLLCSTILLLSLRSSRGLWIVQAAIGAFVVASFAWTGHGSMDSGAAGLLHRGSDIAHLLAAGVWVGALVPLSIQVLRSIASRSRVQAGATERALERFSGVGAAVVCTLILTGTVNSWFLIGPARWRELFTMPYGRLLLVKLALFVLMLMLAAANRYRLVAALNASITASSPVLPAMRALRLSVMVETALALLVIAVVEMLGTLTPPVANE